MQFYIINKQMGGDVMTKQEVQNNIRYNQNLVSQYEREISNLYGQINSQDSKIRQLDGQIGGLRARKQSIDGEYSELQRLRSKLQSLRDNFSVRQSKRVSGFNKNVGNIINVKFIKSYISGMRDLLSGQEYRNTYNGITSAIDKVNSQIQAKQREIESVQAQINSAQRNIDNARSLINSYQRSIEQRKGDISYRRQRIRYWEGQLQYAT